MKYLNRVVSTGQIDSSQYRLNQEIQKARKEGERLVSVIKNGGSDYTSEFLLVFEVEVEE